MQKTDRVLAAVDHLTTVLHSALNATNEVVKELLILWLESLETSHTSHQQTTRNDCQALVTIKELAALWHVNQRSIREWMTKENLPYRRVGADLRFDLIEVDEWTKRHRENNCTATGASNGKVMSLQTRLQARKGA